MAQLQKIDSNVSGLRYAVETAIGVLPPSPIWNALEPNGYQEFGGQLTTVARAPINAGRQRKKGVVTDLDASGGFGTDLTQDNMQDLLQSFCFALFRRKDEAYIDSADGTGEHFELHNRTVSAVAVNAAGSGYAVGDFVTATGTGAETATFQVTSVDGSGGITGLDIIYGGAYNTDPTTTANALVTATGSGSSATADLTLTNIAEDWQENDIVYVTGFVTETGNNGLHLVDSDELATNVELNVTTDLADETLAGDTDARAVRVGHQATADDIDVSVSGNYATYTSTALDFTTLGLIPGEWIYVGGDTGLQGFSNSQNNGFKRVRSVSANALVVDKSATTMIAETSSGSRTVRFWFGRVLKNESDATNQVRRTLQLERTLGAPDTASPSDIQAEYLVGAVANEFSFQVPTADKLVCDLSFVAINNTQIDAATALKTGSRPTLQDADAFNTSSDFSRIKMSVHSLTAENPDALFAYVTELTLTINNGVTPNKAVGVLGAFEVTAGDFVVNGNVTAYFADVASVQAVRNNSDVTLDMHLVKANGGISIDVPLIALGEGRLNVEKDQPITLPLSLEAATAAKLDTALDHTLMMVFYDYLPDAADV